MSSPYVHGSTDDHEVQRLVVQARFVAGFALESFDAPEGSRVLDLGTGVGAMAAELARRYPRITLTGVDLSEAQLAAARAKNPVATYVHADAARLPFPDASFDRVHATWLLEHVPDPRAVLREARRVLAPGGFVHVCEVDNASLRVSPPLPELSVNGPTRNWLNQMTTARAPTPKNTGDSGSRPWNGICTEVRTRPRTGRSKGTR